MIGQPAEFVDQEAFIDTTLDLIMIYFQFATPFSFPQFLVNNSLQGTLQICTKRQ